jgi:hypothetical protein
MIAGRKISGSKKYLLRQDHLERIVHQKPLPLSTAFLTMIQHVKNSFIPPTLKQETTLKNKFKLFVFPLDENR